MASLKRLSLLISVLLLAVLSCGTPMPPEPDAGPRTPAFKASASPPFNPRFARVVSPEDSRSQDEIDAAACVEAFTGRWRCKRPQGARPTFAAVGGPGAPIIPGSWTVQHWFVDPQNTSTTASDSNSCTSAGAACLTWQEIAVHRLGCANERGCVRLRQTTDVKFLSSHTNNSDPVYDVFALENSGSFTVFAALPTPTVTSHFTSVTQASGCNTPHANDGASAAFGSPLQFVVDSTDGASFWCIDTSSGTNICSNTVALTNATAPPTAFQTPGIWGTMTGAAGALTGTANYTAYANLVAVDVVRVNPVIADYSGSTPTNGAFLYHVQVLDPSGTPGVNPIEWGAGAVAYESRIDRTINLVGNSTKDDGCVNCLINGGLTGGRLDTGHFWHMLSGQVTSNSSIVNITGLGVAIDGYARITSIAPTFAQGISMGLIQNQLTTWTLSGYSTSAAISPGYAAVSNGVQLCGGSATINVNGGGTWLYDSSHGGLTGLITSGTPTLEIEGTTTAESHSGTSPVVVTGGISITPTNVDGAASTTAFGGAVYGKPGYIGKL